MRMNVFVIPDIHLKPWIVEKASKLIEDGCYEKIVMLGDFVDDWYQQRNLELYSETLAAITRFLKRYGDDVYICLGNHDISYIWEAHETGYSTYARDMVVYGLNEMMEFLPAENTAYIHRIENILFSHAGLTEAFVKRVFGRGPKLELDDMISRINSLPKDYIWSDDSPIWARPQYGEMRMYPVNMMQVVGHTPVEAPLEEQGGKLLTLDTFSTFPDGRAIGDQMFVWVDSVTEKWRYCNV